MTIQNKQQPKQYTSRIIIKSLEGGGKHIFVRCKVGGTKSLMLIDTGCSNTVFDSGSEVFAGIRLHELKGTNKNFSLNAAIDDVKIGKIKDFAIGRFKVNINRGVFISLEQINSLYESMLGQRIIGILGSDFMRKYKAIIDFGKGSMSVEN
ncbi:MAG: aspartyl protease family protein [Bacteroidales bacterium]|nr:aspartyl protease family protein [Bacteroidales bacterium]